MKKKLWAGILPFSACLLMLEIGHAQFPPPVITQQPQGQSVPLGRNATFSVEAFSTTEMTYQWRFNGNDIQGALAATYTRYNVQTNHAGNYSVQIVNAGGAVISSNALLKVLLPPVITSHPFCQVLPPGGKATFRVAVDETNPLRPAFQWRLNGLHLSDETNALLVVRNCRPAQAGIYTVSVSNVAGVVTSHSAALSLASSCLRSQWAGMPQPGKNPFLFSVPDPYGAAGPAGILASINSRIIYYGKTGATIWEPTALGDFWAPAGNGGTGNSDPKVAYDPELERFFVMNQENAGTNSFLNLAISKNSDPRSSTTEDWRFYRVEMTEVSGTERYGLDYPTFGFDGQCLYICYNLFALPLAADSRFRNCVLLAFDKQQLAQGQCVFTKRFTPPGREAGFALQPVTVLGSNSAPNRAWFVETPLADAAHVRVWALTDPLGAGSLSSTLVEIPDNGGPASGAPQLGTNLLIETTSPLSQGNAYYLNGALWFCHTAGGRFGRAMVHYYQIHLNDFPEGPPTLGEAGRIDPGPGISTFLPALGANARGDLCLAFCQSSPSNYPAIAYTTRPLGAGQFDTPAFLKLSPTFFFGEQWGHFACVTADPVDGSFWIFQEWARSRNYYDWGTWIANVGLYWTPRLDSIQWTAEGTWCQANLPPGLTWILEASSDLRNWSAVPGTNTSAGKTLWLDPQAASLRMRHYRLRGE